MTLFGRGAMSAQLSGGKRTSRGWPVSVAIDPVALGYRQIIIESLEILKAIERSGRLAASFSIIRGASDSDGANEVPRTRCRSASSRHWCTDCPVLGFGNLHSGRTARNSRDLR